MRVGSLFSGIGGIDLGLERAGMEVVWQCEIDPYCQRVLSKHWPDVPCYDDVRDIDEQAPKVDLLCGGFPCQPVSHAGRRKGAEDDRWLWPEFVRVIRAIRPRWVLAENVPGLLSIEAGRLFGRVLRDLAESGYDAEWDCIPAAALGAPHQRDRVLVVANTDSTRCSDERVHPGADSEVGRGTAGQPNAGRSDVADADPSGWPRRTGVFGQRGRGELANSGGWTAQCRLGEPSHGLPDGLDCDGWECGVPRIVTGQKNRVARLRALGNAVVPQVAEYVGRLIMEADARRRVR